jgi:hypothetical protein
MGLRAVSCFTKFADVGGEAVRGVQGGGVVVTQHAPAALQRVLVQAARGLRVAEFAQVGGEAMGGREGVRVIVAQDAAAAFQRVLVQAAQLSAWPKESRDMR